MKRVCNRWELRKRDSDALKSQAIKKSEFRVQFIQVQSIQMSYQPVFDDGKPKFQNRYMEVPTTIQAPEYSEESMMAYQQYHKRKLDEMRNTATDKNDKKQKFPEREVRATSQVVCISSALRDLNLDPTVSNFEVSLGKTFRDVYSIQIKDLQFASSANVISTNNNTISWINAEDIDLGFPIYTATLRNGTYTATTLEKEISDKMNALRRRNGLGTLHYFLVKIDLNTSIVSFTSLSNLALPPQPINTTVNSNSLQVNLLNHGFAELDTVYFSNILSLPGIDSSLINGQALSVQTVLNDDVFSVEVNAAASTTGMGGGSSAFVGSPAQFKFLWGSTSNTCADVLGFADQDTGVPIGVKNPLTSRVLAINAVVPGMNTYITSYSHGLQSGDSVKMIGLKSTPPSIGADGNGQIVTVTMVDSPDTFYTDFATTTIDMSSIGTAFLGTSILTLRYINHGFNQIIGITALSGNLANIQTVLGHNLSPGTRVYLGGTNSIPDLLGYYMVDDVSDDLNFTIDAGSPITTPGTRGIINATGRNIIRNGIPAGNGSSLVTVTTANEHGLYAGQSIYLMFPSALPTPVGGLYVVTTIISGYTFIFDHGTPLIFTGPPNSGSVVTFAESLLLYGVVPTKNFTTTAINNVRFTIRDILDADYLTFSANGSYEQSNNSVTFGGIDALVSSDQHGFAGSISNVDSSNVLIRPVNLSGPDLVFLCAPGLGLDTIVDAGSNVTDIVDKFLLSGEPGTVLFDQFSNLQNIFRRGLFPELSSIRFQLRNADGSFLETNNVDYTMSLVIVYMAYLDTGNMMNTQSSLKLYDAEEAMKRAIQSGRI